MSKKEFWIDFLFGNVTLVIATMALTVANLMLGNDHPKSIIGIAVFVILHAIINFLRERSIVRRLGRNHDQIHHRVVRLISDLGQITGGNFDLWMIDLYLRKSSLVRVSRCPFIKKDQILSRQLSVSLVDKRPQLTSIDLDSGPHGKCYEEARPVLCFDQETHGAHTNNTWSTFDSGRGDESASTYGVLAVSPLVDDLGKGCVGVLAIHVGPERNNAFKALSALTSQHGPRVVNEACADLHGFLAK